jgi:hypothetical protein
MMAVALVAVAVPSGASPSQGSGIVTSVVKAPIDPAGDVTGEPTDFVINLDTSLDPAVNGRTLLDDKTIKVTLPEDFEYLGGGVENPGPGCPPAVPEACGTGVLLQGWPQNPIPPSPANYTIGLEGTHTIVYTAARDLIPGDPTFNGPGIKQMHLILNNYVNPKPGRYEFHVAAETGPEGALETGVGVVHIRPKPRASINVTSVRAGDPGPPFANTIYQTTTTNSTTPFDWTFLVWDRRGEPALDVTVHQINSRKAQLKQGNRVIGQISISAPRGATGQEVSGGPSVEFNAPVKGLPTGRLTVVFRAGDTAGLYTTTLRMNNGTSVSMYVTAAD